MTIRCFIIYIGLLLSHAPQRMEEMMRNPIGFLPNES